MRECLWALHALKRWRTNTSIYQIFLNISTLISAYIYQKGLGVRLQQGSPGKEVQGPGYGQVHNTPRMGLQYRVCGEWGWIGVMETQEGGSRVGPEVWRWHGVIVITLIDLSTSWTLMTTTVHNFRLSSQLNLLSLQFNIECIIQDDMIMPNHNTYPDGLGSKPSYAAILAIDPSSSEVKCWNSNSMGARGYVKGGLELAPMGPFNVEQGGVNSGPDSRRVPEWVQTDRPGFSLCTVPLESSSPGFQDGEVGGMNERRSRGILDRGWWRGLTARGGVRAGNINGT